MSAERFGAFLVQALLAGIRSQLQVLLDRPCSIQSNAAEEGERNSVFLSHRLEETAHVELLERLLQDNGFTVVKGYPATGSVSQAVLERIRACDYFFCLMTRAHEKKDGTFLTSGWILQELGSGVILCKPLAMMVEDGVTDYGGLQGDLQRIPFTRENFPAQASIAVDLLRRIHEKINE